MKTFQPVFLILLLTIFQGYAQDNKAALKKANEYFNYEQYKEAIPLYQSVLRSATDDPEVNFRIGFCYLMGAEKAKAIRYLKNAFSVRPEINSEIHYYLGRAYQANHQYKEAKSHYELFLKTVAQENTAVLAQVNKKLAECETGEELISDPVKARIDNIGGIVNSRFEEYAPVISADESILIFTSRRESSTGEELTSDDKYYEDVYISYNNKGQWSSPQNLGHPVNSKTHDACVALSPDGKQLFIYNDKNGGDILTSRQKPDKTWTKPETLGKNINSKYRESSVSITKDGQRLYFSSDRPGGFGGMDIYMSTLQEKGQWGEAVNLGPTINTGFDDDAPFIHPDGFTLYFSSRGHAGMGGYDIFRSETKSGKWTSPENIGYPINTAEDDIYFVLSADNKHGYYASEMPGGKGEKDIYVISMPAPDKIDIPEARSAKVTFKEIAVAKPVIAITPVNKVNPTTILKGVIRDAMTQEPLSTNLLLIDNERSEVVSEQVSDSLTGSYTVIIPSGKNYGLAIEKEGYLFHSENFDLPPSTDYQEISKDVELKKVAIGSRIVLRNIFFDTGKANLRPESAYELEKLVELLNEASSLEIEIAGHTDNIGKMDLNQQLSEERAKSVVNYLVSKGISNERLRSAGYGSTKPFTTNDTEDGRQLNRRTEFEIVGN
jgi:outer membrane protein OmpA-like peptidoglycan-associated protein